MPQYNTLAPRTNAFVGNQLERSRHTQKHKQDGFLSITPDKYDQSLSTLARLGTSSVYHRVGTWRYPSSYVPVRRSLPRVATRTMTKTATKKKRKTKRKRCCRFIKGKKVCKPEFCGKKKFYYSGKKYWY